jgi:hypothetical protein
MNTELETLREQYRSLLTTESQAAFNVQVALELLEGVRSLGLKISAPPEREELSQLARDIGEMCYRNTGQYPTTRLKLPQIQEVISDLSSSNSPPINSSSNLGLLMGDEVDLIELRFALGNFQDMRILEAAIRKAEVLDIEGELPDSLKETLRNARTVFDRFRQELGEMTSIARFGDLGSRKEVCDRLLRMTREGISYVYDVNRQETVPTQKLLQEWLIYYEETSSNLTDYELEKVSNMLPFYPRGALTYLRRLTESTPLAERDLARISARVVEIESQVNDLEHAEAILRAADKEESPLLRLDLLLRAHEIYPNVRGLDYVVENARWSAANTLQYDVQNLLNQARIS